VEKQENTIKAVMDFMDPENVKARTELRLKVDAIISERDRASASPPIRKSKSTLRESIA
jgi:hypothetical protein